MCSEQYITYFKVVLVLKFKADRIRLKSIE